ncbi:NHL repeat-containing protein 3 isoform X1 [Molossus molossus]|uniref:NHL repeat-containing protein 3 n=2 Tax=Molossus molossus TaxID=27622 RepID=A0A7J8GLH3_MOLMO|nr:NHL repeat-containing protein 3 isoform X1 [Molossus molossus]KAF6460760.1 NHL repeat containing 3 [Molossus molossus]
MARLWLWAGGAGLFLALLVLRSRFSGCRVLQEFAFRIPRRTEEVLYRLDVGWPTHPEHFTGTTFCVAVDSLNGLVYVAQRGDNIPKVLVFTEDGYFLRGWNDTVDTPHGMFATSTPQEQSIWITDVGSGSFGHTVKKYNSFGDLVQVVGTPGKRGTGLNPLQFDSPAELYVEDTGDLYIVDGDGGLNNRLIKLSQDLMMLWLHGENGTGPAQFSIPHSVTVDSSGRVWVADRGNKRVQVFDKDTGAWLGAWTSCFTEEGPSSVRFTPDGKYLVVAQLNLSRLLVVAAPPVGDLGPCSVVSTIQLADQVLPHLLDVSAETGAVYVAEIGAKQVQKYVPLEGSFPSFR